MKTTTSLALALALALGSTAPGCSAADSEPTVGDDGGGDGGGGGGSGSVKPPRPLDASGTYVVHSTFDLATNMPGTAGTVVNTMIAMTDGQDDPTRWIVDQIIAQLPDGSVKSAVSFGKELVIGYLNEKLLDIAPDFVSTMVLVGHDFGDIAKHFGLTETLELTGGGTRYTAVHSVTGVHWKLGNQDIEHVLASYRLPNLVVSDVAITMDATGELTIDAHALSLAYGKLLRLGLDAAIIPAIDPTAHSLNELLAHQIDCAAVGNAIADQIGFGASAIKTACTLGLTAGANFVYSKIDAIDGTALTFGIHGDARAQDTNGDRTIDAIQFGEWNGTLSYGATPTPLVPAAFSGERR